MATTPFDALRLCPAAMPYHFACHRAPYPHHADLHIPITYLSRSLCAEKVWKGGQYDGSDSKQRRWRMAQALKNGVWRQCGGMSSL